MWTRRTCFGLLLAALAALSPSRSRAEDEPKPEDVKVVTLGKSKLGLYGFLRLDTLYDTDRPNTIQTPVFVLSPDLNPPQGLAAGRSSFSMHPRLSRFGVDLEAPAIKGLNDATLGGKLEIDFYNLPASPTSLNSNSREFLRLRHAWLELTWGRFSLLAGQREDVLSPLTPIVNNDLVMWGAGNLGDRRPQLRVEYVAGGLAFTGMAGVTGAVDNQNLDGPTNAFFDGEASGIPTFQARIGFTFDGPATGKKAAVGIWGHRAEEELDSGSTFANGRSEFDSRALGADLSLPLPGRVLIKAEAWTGENLDDVRGGIFQGVVNGEEIESRGGWVEVHLTATPWWTPIVGLSLDDPESEFLPVLTPTTNPGPDKNVVAYLANRMRWGSLELGADYLRWRTEFAGSGVRDGQDHRYNGFLAYHF